MFNNTMFRGSQAKAVARAPAKVEIKASCLAVFAKFIVILYENFAKMSTKRKALLCVGLLTLHNLCVNICDKC